MYSINKHSATRLTLSFPEVFHIIPITYYEEAIAVLMMLIEYHS